MNRRRFLKLLGQATAASGIATLPIIGKLAQAQNELKIDNTVTKFQHFVLSSDGKRSDIQFETDDQLPFQVNDLVRIRYKGFSGRYLVRGWHKEYNASSGEVKFGYRLQDIESYTKSIGIIS